MEFENLKLDVQERISTLTIDRPKVLNALNSQTMRELEIVVDRLAKDEDIRGVILTGSGDKAFVAGADISELASKNPVSAREIALTGQRVLNKIEQLPKLVIAAVNGFALGGGCELAMACHMRVASAHAKFGQPEVGLGIIPGYGGTQRLPRLVGKGIALEILLGGNIVDADEAYRIGLVNRVINAWKTDKDGKDFVDEKGRKMFDRDAFLANVMKTMKGFLSKGPVAQAYVIEAVNRGLDDNLETALDMEADIFSVLFATTDMTEGTKAFLEKREAKFTGK